MARIAAKTAISNTWVRVPVGLDRRPGSALMAQPRFAVTMAGSSSTGSEDAAMVSVAIDITNRATRVILSIFAPPRRWFRPTRPVHLEGNNAAPRLNVPGIRRLSGVQEPGPAPLRTTPPHAPRINWRTLNNERTVLGAHQRAAQRKKLLKCQSITRAPRPWRRVECLRACSSLRSAFS